MILITSQICTPNLHIKLKVGLLNKKFYKKINKIFHFLANSLILWRFTHLLYLVFKKEACSRPKTDFSLTASTTSELGLIFFLDQTRLQERHIPTHTPNLNVRLKTRKHTSKKLYLKRLKYHNSLTTSLTFSYLKTSSILLSITRTLLWSLANFLLTILTNSEFDLIFSLISPTSKTTHATLHAIL